MFKILSDLFECFPMPHCWIIFVPNQYTPDMYAVRSFPIQEIPQYCYDARVWITIRFQVSLRVVFGGEIAP